MADTTERRAPVQASRYELIQTGPGRGYSIFGSERGAPRDGKPGAVPGTIAWAEHVEAWNDYAHQNGNGQSAERMAERGGFDWHELCDHLKREPTTWRPR